MKKLFCGIVTVLVMSLAACSGDDAIDTNQLLGNWESDGYTYKVERVRTGEVLTDTFCQETSRWSFYENFTGKQSIRGKYGTTNHEFTYDPEDRTVKFGMTVLTIDRISSGTMRISLVRERYMEKYDNALVAESSVWELRKVEE